MLTKNFWLISLMLLKNQIMIKIAHWNMLIIDLKRRACTFYSTMYNNYSLSGTMANLAPHCFPHLPAGLEEALWNYTPHLLISEASLGLLTDFHGARPIGAISRRCLCALGATKRWWWWWWGLLLWIPWRGFTGGLGVRRYLSAKTCWIARLVCVYVYTTGCSVCVCFFLFQRVYVAS